MPSEPISPLTEPSPAPRRRFSLARVALQLVGFALGVALVVWCVRTAAVGADWERVRHADPWLFGALLATTLVSSVINACTFWTALRPVKRHSIWRLTLLNGVAGVLNYAPVRLGLVARLAYNLRVDALRPGVVAAWMLAVLGYTMLALVVVGVAVIATPLGALTVVLIATLFVVGKLLLKFACSLRTVQAATRRLKLDSLEPMLVSPIAYWGTLLYRLADIGAFVARMWLSARILGLELAPSDIVLLATTAQLVSLSPLGRLGFREAAVAVVASRLQSGLGAGGVDAVYAQLALIESAGEAAIIVPLGVLSLPWYWWSMRRRKRAAAETVATGATAA